MRSTVGIRVRLLLFILSQSSAAHLKYKKKQQQKVALTFLFRSVPP